MHGATKRGPDAPSRTKDAPQPFDPREALARESAWARAASAEEIAAEVVWSLEGPSDRKRRTRATALRLVAGSEVADAALDWAQHRTGHDVLRACSMVVDLVDPDQTRRLWATYKPHWGADPEGKVVEAVLARLVTPGDVLEDIATGLAREDLESMCAHPNVPRSVLESVVGDPDGDWEWAAKSPRLTEDLARKMLASGRDEPWRLGDFAAGSGLDDETLMSLAPREQWEAEWLSGRVAERCGIDERNIAAIEALLDQPWWTYSNDSEEVALALALWPNP